ncbi:hypothetical protein QAD02_010033 [Eretmocerus hayati]|uniref:Uncharacterized protein n=1 Tax=Eretmocerus hayati TaxID=131215 RepID=A0ACC2NFL1_9HYME|nr:hypothetical protein QAD02_010033 [Eretmocerus hayati]
MENYGEFIQPVHDGQLTIDKNPSRNLGNNSPEEIVISGMAGRFPESDNVEELHRNLISKVDMVTDDDRRWTTAHPDIPKRTGKVRNIEKFDALFFSIPTKLVQTMDPMGRMLLEHTYEAIIDAGVNPRSLRGRKIGVFVALSYSETETVLYNESRIDDGHPEVIGFSRALFANRVSYCFGFTGPSYTVDTACSSSLTAMENAYRAIKAGSCEGAIVSGVNLCLFPQMSMMFHKIGVLSPDGRCKTFDESADGYARSEAISVLFMQKAKDAKRIYATVLNVRINCDGFKEHGIAHPSTIMHTELLRDCYNECGISPSCVEYVEAHGTGTEVGDPVEVASLDETFCKNANRNKPLMIGSVKSNLGHSEAPSGLVGVTKVLLAMEHGVLPPNLHLNNLKKTLKPIVEGRMKVVTDVTPWIGKYAGINSFGFGGANGHTILKSNEKQKKLGEASKNGTPFLVTVSGRTEQSVSVILDNLKEKPIDSEFVGLLHEIHSHNIKGHLYRGYAVLEPTYPVHTSFQEVTQLDEAERPIWFIFSGMGSQWLGMGKDLLRLPKFAESIEKCDAALKPLGVDIYHVLTTKEETFFDNVLNAFVGIAAIQIGMVDVLYSLGIKPDYMIGHSLGENACAYADGSLTAEQMVLTAYYRGLVSIETDFIHGTMAAVGLGCNDLEDICPSDIVVACHNSSTSSTISGPTPAVEAFVEQLQAKGIFAKKVQTGNIPYHSFYLEEAAPKYLECMRNVIPDPLPRSEIWYSTSVREENWDCSEAKLSSAEYFTNNLLGPVLFEEVLDKIHKNAITIEIGPHGLLQAILRRALDSSIAKVALSMRDHDDNLSFFLQSVGKLFNLGLQPQIAELHPKIEYPVSRGTQSISPLIKWDHSEDWFVCSGKEGQENSPNGRSVQVSLKNGEYSLVADHIVDGRIIFPATGYLKLVWESFGIMLNKSYTDVPVIFKDVRFLRATNIPEDASVIFKVAIHSGSGRFEITEGQTTIVTGSIFTMSHPDKEKLNIPTQNEDEEVLTTRDIYKKLRLCGYDYRGTFRGIKSCNISGTKGHIIWHDEWISFLDNMLQMSILSKNMMELQLPINFEKLIIDPQAHLDLIKTHNPETGIPVNVNMLHDVVISGGVEVWGLAGAAISRRRIITKPVLEEYKFVPFQDKSEMSISDIARVISQIVFENSSENQIKVIELTREGTRISMSEFLSIPIEKAFADIPLAKVEIKIVTSSCDLGDLPLLQPASIVKSLRNEPGGRTSLAVGYDLFGNNCEGNTDLLIDSLKPGGFLLAQEDKNVENFGTIASEKELDIILEKKCDESNVILFRKRQKIPDKIMVVRVDNENFEWVGKMQSAMSEAVKNGTDEVTRVIFVGIGDFDNGLMGLINCLRKEPGGEIVRGILIQDPKASDFDLEDQIYKRQISKDLSISVFREKGIWGTYRHLLLPLQSLKESHHGVASQLVGGDISSVKWLEGPIRPGFKHDHLVHTVCASFNFRDIMLATGKLGKDTIVDYDRRKYSSMGFEFCGYNALGERVMGILNNSAFTNLCMSDRKLTIKIPDSWTFEEAATVPVAYATCYYALYIKGGIKKGDKILIHVGSGGVGQAAIHLALHEGCEIFTTVGTPEKRQFIRDNFPQIKDDHIGNSRDTSFKQMIMEQTKGRGVDMVLNSLAEEKLEASVACLACGGKFLEIGKYDAAANNPLGMKAFLRDISFHAVMLDLFLFGGEEENKIQIVKYIEDGLRSGAVKPLVRKIFQKEEIESALRYMAAGKHIGKIILKIRDNKEPLDVPMKTIPRYHCHEDRSYIILGGLGGFGLELADWLTERGAKNLILTSRTGIKNGYQKMKVKEWEDYGIRVTIITGKDASNQDECEFILKTASQLAPVDGIFNLATVLRDALWENQTPKYFEDLFRCKAWGTKNLDEISRKLCPLLRHFVVFSSTVCGRGNPGQTNYGMANSVMERICERRAAEGLPALAIQWGLIGDVGIVAESSENSKQLTVQGCSTQKISSCLEELDRFLNAKNTVVSSIVVAEKKTEISTSVSVVDTVLKTMGFKSLAGISLTTSLSELGMDSMMAVEIKQTLEREHGVFLNTHDLRNLNFNKLQKISDKHTEYPDGKMNFQSPELESEKEARSEGLINILLGSKEIHSKACVELCKSNSRTNRVFVIPGIEGYSSVFKKLSPKLKIPTTCIQLTLNATLESIEHMTHALQQELLQKMDSRKHFAIVGYSFGSLIAIELVRILESMNASGELILIDGAPDLMKSFIRVTNRNDNDDELQDNTLLSLGNLIKPEKCNQLAEELKRCTNWNERVQYFFRTFPKPLDGMTIEFEKCLCRVLYLRRKAALNYDPGQRPKIKTPIKLIKPTVTSVKMSEEDYGLSKVTSGGVSIMYAKGDHLSILDDENVANEINKMIRQE